MKNDTNKPEWLKEDMEQSKSHNFALTDDNCKFVMEKLYKQLKETDQDLFDLYDIQLELNENRSSPILEEVYSIYKLGRTQNIATSYL